MCDLRLVLWLLLSEPQDLRCAWGLDGPANRLRLRSEHQLAYISNSHLPPSVQSNTLKGATPGDPTSATFCVLRAQASSVVAQTSPAATPSGPLFCFNPFARLWLFAGESNTRLQC
ncbi:hypothetical protein BDW22DRAFT_1358808 [Trametopsis cervina]|nr:hypothetical protein BDW22DRAFT_1358808 [Trametopsis cervina]